MKAHSFFLCHDLPVYFNLYVFILHAVLILLLIWLTPGSSGEWIYRVAIGGVGDRILIVDCVPQRARNVAEQAALRIALRV